MNKKIKVFFDGQCPLCSREIEYYKRQKGAELIDWVNIYNSSSIDYPDQLSPEQALKRFHVLDSNGKLVSGGQGFVILWSALPKFYFLSKIFSKKYMGWLLEHFYNFFVLIRPYMQRSYSFLITVTGKHS
jgi:predicted DCC family thiol-disulfide oxidoreductase YuxK